MVHLYRRRFGSRGRCFGGWRGHGLVYQILEFLAGLEIRNALGRDFHTVSGLGITANSGLTLARAETAISANFDLVACAQRLYNTVENRLDDNLGIFSGSFPLHVRLLQSNRLWSLSCCSSQTYFLTFALAPHVDYFLNCHGSSHGLALIVFQACALLIFRNGTDTQGQFFFSASFILITLKSYSSPRFKRGSPFL